MQVRFAVPFLLFGMAGNATIALAQSSGTFTAIASMTVPRAGHTATLLLNGNVLIAGGFNSSGFNEPVASAELYDPSTGTFTPTGNMITARRGHTATLLADGRVLIAGGHGLPVSKTELYDPSMGTFVSTGDKGDVTSEGGLSRVVLLANGKVLIAGGSVAQVYDPTSGTLSATSAYTHSDPAFVSTATLLPEGKVLLTGCVARCTAGVTALYDPGAGTFSAIGSMTKGWGNVNTATLLMNGKFLLAGNAENDGFPADAEEYNPVTGTFTHIGRTIGPHQFSTATLIPDGTVLISGGQLPGGSGDRGAELYAPTTGIFASAGSMTTARHSHTTTLLPDGSVLIAGGFSVWPQPTSRAEIYRPAVLVPPPALMSLSQDGQRQGAILHAGTAQVASSNNPATAGETLEIYCTGLPSGSAIPPQVAIGGRAAEILFFGDAPGFAGLNQVNVRVPSGVAPGPAVPARLTYLGRPSNEVTIGVQ
jgi:large repetitive protein